jgi:hypothetical protein
VPSELTAVRFESRKERTGLLDRTFGEETVPQWTPCKRGSEQTQGHQSLSERFAKPNGRPGDGLVHQMKKQFGVNGQTTATFLRAHFVLVGGKAKLPLRPAPASQVHSRATFPTTERF